MNLTWITQFKKPWRLLVVLAGGLMLANGCVIDSDDLLTDLFQAMLDSTSESLVDSLADYLARH